jgi:hypothetical protein
MAGLTLEQAQFFEEQALQMGVPAEWMADWLSRNPGDQHRILDAYAGEAGGQTAVAARIVQAGGLAHLDTLAPARPLDPPPIMPGGAGSFPALFGGNGGFSLTTVLVLAAMAGAAWYLWRKR